MGELNLLPYSLKRKQVNSMKKKRYFITISSIAIIVILAFCIPVFLYFFYSNKESAVQESLNEMQILYSKNKNIESSIKTDRLYLKSVDMMTNGKYSTKDNIELFQTFMTKDMYLTSFAYSRQGVQISGKAQNYNSPSIFAANMQLSKQFADVKLMNVNVEQGGISFTISVTY